MNLLGVFAKYWQPGTVKTRLAAAIGEQAACDLYRSFIEATLSRLAGQADRRVVVYWPSTRRNEFLGAVPAGWDIAPQADGDLGQRMRSFFAQAFCSGTDRAVLIGSDSPTLPSEYIDQAFRLLETYPVVLGPSGDGGYYLVGAAGIEPPIFAGITWSTNAVWEQTLTRLEQAGCPFARLPAWYDVDEFLDLERLRAELVERIDGEPNWRELLAAVTTALANKKHG